MSTTNEDLKAWVEKCAQLTKPDKIHWCDGSPQERRALIEQMLESGELIRLNEQSNPDSYLHRSNPTDVARTEHLTFICTHREADAGPNNNWMAPDDAHRMVDAVFNESMRGRTMFVVPYVMGPVESPYAQCGVELTDSLYVAVSMGMMTRMGAPALKRIEDGEVYVKGLHALSDLDPDRRFIMHFPEQNLIKSVGSGYGGNALLGKKCHALRIASHHARDQGWLAEHMLIVGVENPQGETHYIAAAFPSACGKTNLAMLIPPERFKGWKVHTIGDDIAWMHVGADGRMWAINPEAGLFGVAPGTGPKTNPNAVDMISRDTIFTNVALTAQRQPWWEGLTKEPPPGLTDWRGNPYTNGAPAAHPNSRFTVAIERNPSYDPIAQAPQGVPISAIIFGGRRPNLLPLVMQSHSWNHGVFMGASVASQTTAAATGQVGVVRRDPMAMKPFCGYNMADYWNHWLSFSWHSSMLPKIFHVNWFRQDEQGKFIWPGFGDNLRVLQWVIERCKGAGKAVNSPIGFLPTPDAIDLAGLNISAETMRTLLEVDRDAWRDELYEIQNYFYGYGSKTPEGLWSELRRVEQGLR